MSSIKDQSIFKSSGMFVLQSPSKQSLLTNSNFFTRPSSKEITAPRRISQQSEQLTTIQRTVQESLPYLSEKPLLKSISKDGSRKSSLQLQTFNSEQLKDWLVGKQFSPSNENVQQEKSENQSIKNSIIAIKKLSNNLKQSDPYCIQNNKNSFDMVIENQEKGEQQNIQSQERQIIKRVQRRAQSDLVPLLSNKSESPQLSPIVLNENDKNKLSNENEGNVIANSSQLAFSARRRSRFPSLNDQTLKEQEKEVQQFSPQKQQQNQQIKQEVLILENKKQDSMLSSDEISSEKKTFQKSAIFASPNKYNRFTFLQPESSPSRSPQKMMESSQSSFYKSGSKAQFSLNNLPSYSQQSSKNFTHRQILLKDLQNIPDSQQLYELTNSSTFFNAKQSGVQINIQHTNLLNQQLNKKPNIFNSPQSTASQSSLDEVLPINNQASSASLKFMPIIRKRNSKNSSLQNFDNLSKPQINMGSTKSFISSNGLGSFSSFDNLSEQQPQISNQPKGILKSKNIASKQKKSVVFDNNLQIHQIDQIIQA